MPRRGAYVRWWQGAIVGAVIGAALWQASSIADGWSKPAIVNGATPRQFAQTIANAANSDRRLEDVVVHPPLDGKHRVTAHVTGGGRPDLNVELFASIPFVAPPVRNVPAGTFADVRGYLAAADVVHRYAWWERPDARAAIWIVPPTFAFGALLPAALLLLIRLGLLAPPPVPEPKVKAKPPSPPEPAKAETPVDMDAVRSQLDAATEAIEQNLAASPIPDGVETPTSVASASPVLASSAPPDEPTAPAAPGEEKVYDGGAYYPVSRPRREGH